MNNDIISDGDLCVIKNCDGTLKLTQEPCFCSATSMPPCSSCENSILACDTCDWNEDEDPGDWDLHLKPKPNTITYDKSMKKLF